MKKKKYSLANNLLFYYRQLYAYSPAIVIKQGIFIAISVLLPLFSIYLPKIMIDFVQRRVSVTVLAAGLGGFIIMTAALSGISLYLRDGVYMERNFFREYLMYFLFRKLLRTEYRYTEDGEYRKKYNAAMDTNKYGDYSVPSRLFDCFPYLIIQSFCFLLYSAVIGMLHPAILLLLVCMSGINYWMRERERLFQNEMRDRQNDNSRKRMAVEACARNVQAAKDLRIFGLEGWIEKTVEKLIGQEREYARQCADRVFGRECIGQGLNLVRDAAGYGYLVTKALGGQIGAGDFILYFGAIQGFGNFLNEMIDALQTLLAESDKACLYREYYDLPEEELEEGASAVENLQAPLSIDFCDVSFGYTEGKDVISHFSLHIDPGERIALVGENGAGKTTLVKLLAGFYEPREGCIKIGGIDCRTISKKERYRLFSAVFQENRCFPFTVLENLTLQTANKADRGRAIEALKQAGIWQDFVKNKISLDSYMTKVFLDYGIELSGGQQQRFMLARALYQDAPVLLLDEPTAALDPKAESEIYDSYAQMTEGKTAIFVSHRLASTRFSDRIILLQDGKIAESGTHEQLLADKKAYAQMFALQASYYKDEKAEENSGEDQEDGK